MTTTAGVVQAYDDDGCGTPGGHASLTFTPTTSATYFVRVHKQPGCSSVGPEVALLQIQCSAGSCPGPGDDPCASTPPASCNPNIPSCPAVAGATLFPALTPTCTTLNGSTAGATGTSGIAPPPCGVYPNSSDVWFGAWASATGTLALDVDHVSATNLAMAVYSVSVGCPTPTLNLVTCNADLVPGTVTDPFISMSGLTPNALHYIRIWPEGNATNGGTFTLCAYHPVPPPNDQPCGAIDLDMSNPLCVPATFNTQDATPLTGVTVSGGSPTCTGGVAGNDVWFRITVPAPGGRVTVNTAPGSLGFMAMALYTGACGGPLTEVACNDNNPGGGNMPFIATAAAYPTGTVFYVRIWSQNTGFGTFQICAYLTQPPANDNPCGAIPLNPQYGCMMTGISNENATITPTTLNGPGSVPNPLCGGTPNDDVWYSVVVPPNGEIRIDMDDGQMNDAAFQVYTGPCNGNLVPYAFGCSVSGSTNPGGAAMPMRSVIGLTPGTTVFIRVWRQSGLTGNAFICANRTDNLPVVPGTSCYYTLRMSDTGGDGWNGSYVSVTVGGTTTNYTINSSTGSISFPVTQGQPIVISYTAVGGFQNQISYSVINYQNALIFGDGPTPGTGVVYAGSADCNLPPPPQSDCNGAFRICSASSGLGGNPSNTGAVVDLNGSNRGCLNAENQGLWYTFSASASGTLAFNLTPTAATYTDYDFAVWGPYASAPSCPNGPTGPPVRCSWAAGGGATGLNFGSVDLTEGAGGDSWVRYLDVTVGQYYLMYLDNWSRNGISFNFTFSGTADISCTLLPVDMFGFDAQTINRQVEVSWNTSMERNTSHYFVERSSDGTTFEPIGRVEAVGNSVVNTDYKFMDANPLNGINYYRLQVVDQDNSSNLTQVVTVMFRKTGTPLYVFPNPATESLQASFDGTSDGTVRWRVMDTSGRLVMEGSESGNVGTNRFDVPVSRLDAGSYLLEIMDGAGIPLGNARFVKQ
ncbi:MAG: T9SS type A sorting domain-containing protein [Flavobacteriales bacterium]